jgi:hypothetical protein
MKIYGREKLKKKCKYLRYKGKSLNYIANISGLPKSTVYGYIRNIALTEKQKLNIEYRKKLLLRKPSPKKGKCRPGRKIIKPLAWSGELINIVAHFSFDGCIGSDGCTYYNRSKSQITKLKSEVYNLFGIKPKEQIRSDGVMVISYYNVEFAEYIRNKASEIFSYLRNGATREGKRIFIQAFFDDEGNVYFRKNTRRIRGYQKSIEVLENINRIISEFGIRGRIYPSIGAIEITGREQLAKFAREIGFSPGIALNSLRINSIWKTNIEKREVLNRALASYIK